MKSIFFRQLPIFAIMAASGVSHALTFSNIIITSPPLSTGATYSVAGNSISFYTPNAYVIGVGSGILDIYYDVNAGPAARVNQVLTNLAFAVTGSATVAFAEEIHEIDCAFGNIIGGPLATDIGSFGAGTPFYSNSLILSSDKQCVRVHDRFTLTATQANDIASVAINNQSINTVVPEPASLGALAMGAAALLLRRKKTV